MITGTGKKRVSLRILVFVGLVLLLAAGGAATFTVTNTSDGGSQLSESRVSANNIGDQASPNVDFLANVSSSVAALTPITEPYEGLVARVSNIPNAAYLNES